MRFRLAASRPHPRGRTPFSEELDRLPSGHGSVTCGTGDSFVTSVDPWLVENNIDIVDMELFAIARACERARIPWRSFKFVTDAAGAEAVDDWRARVGDGELMFLERLAALASE